MQMGLALETGPGPGVPERDSLFIHNAAIRADGISCQALIRVNVALIPITFVLSLVGPREFLGLFIIVVQVNSPSLGTS